MPQEISASQLGEVMPSRAASAGVHSGHDVARASALTQARDAGDDLF